MIKDRANVRDLVGEPSVRKLRIFAFDPGVSGTFDQACATGPIKISIFIGRASLERAFTG